MRVASPAPGGTGRRNWRPPTRPARGGVRRRTGPTQFRLCERTYPPEGGERRSPKGIVRSHSKGPVRVAPHATLTGPFEQALRGYSRVRVFPPRGYKGGKSILYNFFSLNKIKEVESTKISQLKLIRFMAFKVIHYCFLFYKAVQLIDN